MYDMKNLTSTQINYLKRRLRADGYPVAILRAKTVPAGVSLYMATDDRRQFVGMKSDYLNRYWFKPPFSDKMSTRDTILGGLEHALDANE